MARLMLRAAVRRQSGEVGLSEFVRPVRGMRKLGGGGRETVLRLLRGEDLESVSRELRITAARASQWRDQCLAAGQAGLKSRAPGKPRRFHVPGRPAKDRAAIARAFVAKAVYDMPTTRVLLDRLATEVSLRRICGWERQSAVPSEAVFSRAFADCAATALPQHIHEALIRNTHHDRLVGHLSRDSTAIEVREKPTTKEKAPEPPKRKRGRPTKGEARPKQLTRLQRQGTMTTSAMLDDLPTDCAVGTKKNSKGHTETWIGYKLHLDVADGQIPISCLATVSAERTTNLYDLMDAAYDAQEIRDHSRSLGHVPLIDINTRRNTSLKDELNAEARRRQLLGFQLPADVRYHERTAGERVNGRLKDEFGARHVRVRGAAKVMCHCMFGVLALTADQLLRLVT